MSAHRRVRGLRAALVQVGESLALITSEISASVIAVLDEFAGVLRCWLGWRSLLIRATRALVSTGDAADPPRCANSAASSSTTRSRTAAAKRETSAGARARLGGGADRQPLPSRAQGTSSLSARATALRRCPPRGPPRYASPRCSRSPPAPRRPTRTRGRKLASGVSSSAVHLASGLERLQAEKRAGEIPPKYDEARQASVSTSLRSLSSSLPASSG